MQLLQRKLLFFLIYSRILIMVHGTNTDSPPDTEPLGRSSILSYGSGHMLNDITSSCWFTYLLLFLTDVGLTPRYFFFPLTVNSFSHCHFLLHTSCHHHISCFLSLTSIFISEMRQLSCLLAKLLMPSQQFSSESWYQKKIYIFLAYF